MVGPKTLHLPQSLQPSRQGMPNGSEGEFRCGFDPRCFHPSVQESLFLMVIVTDATTPVETHLDGCAIRHHLLFGARSRSHKSARLRLTVVASIDQKTTTASIYCYADGQAAGPFLAPIFGPLSLHDATRHDLAPTRRRYKHTRRERLTKLTFVEKYGHHGRIRGTLL